MEYEICDINSYITWPYQLANHYRTVGSHGCIINPNLSDLQYDLDLGDQDHTSHR